VNASLDKFKKQLNQFKKDVEEESRELRVSLAREAFTRIVARSPVSTGSYCLSHRISVGGSRDPSVTRKIFVTNDQEAVKTTALKQLAKLLNVGPFDPITISNSISHNINVEYIGWKKTPAYHVFGLTFIELFIKAKVKPKTKGVKGTWRIR